MRSTLEALSDGTRLRIVEELANQERTAGELASMFEISRPGVSRHLRVLRNARLVSCRTDAQRRVYSLKTEALEELDAWLEKYRVFWSQRLDALGTEIERKKRQEIQQIQERTKTQTTGRQKESK